MTKSKALNKVFYYNTNSKIGQFNPPDAILVEMLRTPHSPSACTPIQAERQADSTAGHGSVGAHTTAESIEGIEGIGNERERERERERESATATPLKDSLVTPTQMPTQTQTPSRSVEERAAAAAAEDADFHQALQESLEEAKDSAGTSAGTRQSSASSSSVLSEAAGAGMDEGQEAASQAGELQHGDEQWTCAPCTYINESSSAACDMCLSARPRPKVSFLLSV
jgi:hypothetical protein